MLLKSLTIFANGFRATPFQPCLKPVRITGTVIEAFNIQLRSEGVIVWSAFGVDGSQPRSAGLLRLVATDDVLATERENLTLNWGGGNDEFKHRRGAVPEFEFDIVFDRHLGPDRRLPWWLMQRARALKNKAPLNPACPDGGGESMS